MVWPVQINLVDKNYFDLFVECLIRLYKGTTPSLAHRNLKIKNTLIL